jgi:hypothetical protein
VTSIGFDNNPVSELTSIPHLIQDHIRHSNPSETSPYTNNKNITIRARATIQIVIIRPFMIVINHRKVKTASQSIDYLKNPGTSLCPNSFCITLPCLACLSKRCITMRCCCEMRGVSQPEERVTATRRGLGSMLAVEEERRERAWES